MNQTVEKTTLKSCSENLKSTFFPYCPELPKQKNSCSKLWLIDGLYIELGFFPLPFYSDEILWRFYFWVYWLDRNVSLFLRCVNFEINEFVSMFIGYIQLCLWFMKLRIVFLRVASPGNKIVAFYVRTLDIRKMEMFQFKFTRQKLAKVQYEAPLGSKILIWSQPTGEEKKPG